MPAVQLTIDCHDAGVLVPFWCLALDYVPSPPPAGHATWNDWYLSVGVPEDELDLSHDGTDRIIDPTGRGARIWFQPVPEVKSVKNRLHLDLFVGQDENGVKYPYAERAIRVRAKADALIAAGATEIGHVTAPEHDRFTVQLADPEGNELCLL